MSGAEAFAVLGAISAVISIVDGIKKVYEAASDKGGLPSAFRAVANRVPLVLETLQTAYDEVQAGNINDATCKAMQKVIEACGTKAKNLDTIIEEVLPEADASRMERYHKALKSLPKGSRVESLMKGILIDMQVLTSNHGMRVATKYETEKLVEAIKELEKLPPSAGNDLTDRGSQSATHNAGGNIYQAMASQYFAADTSRIYNAETMTFSDGKE
ncbi:hypothetical protein LZL87_013725 [Fusarium oxysporum]|nr:hypothetical protein LZL87_013725 [Fusarium oxysporum]